MTAVLMVLAYVVTLILTAVLGLNINGRRRWVQALLLLAICAVAVGWCLAYLAWGFHK